MVNDVVISVKNLETGFGSKTIHKDLSVDIKKNEILVLLGASGSGKSVFLRTLIGLEQPRKGSCFFNDKDVFTNGEKDWVYVRKKIAYAFQGGALFDSLTVEENLSYPLREHAKLNKNVIRAQVSEMLKHLGLPGTEKLLPASLSGGMQKRVGLARAIMLDPEVILYDEPTAGLDPANSRNISETILKLKESGKTSILVTHDIDCALRVADRVAFIYRGKIEVLQTIEEVKSNPHPLIDSYLKGEEVK